MKEQVLKRLAEDRRRLTETQGLVDRLAAEERGLFLWGLNWPFYFYYAQLDWRQSHIKALVDRRPAVQNQRFGGREARGLEALKEAGPGDAVLSFATSNAESMKVYLQQIGFQGFYAGLGELE